MDEKKEKLIKDVQVLKGKGVVKFDSHIAKAIGYTKSAVSDLLNPESKKSPSTDFRIAFDKQYGKYLDIPTEKTSQIEEIKADIEILRKNIIAMQFQMTGKQPALIEAEMEQAKKILLGRIAK